MTAAGAGKSGKPCDKLMLPWRSERRVISRMTDSVNRSAFAELRTLDMATIIRARERAGEWVRKKAGSGRGERGGRRPRYLVGAREDRGHGCLKRPAGLGINVAVDLKSGLDAAWQSFIQ